MREDVLHMIEALVPRNPGQMEFDEYASIAEELYCRGPCSLLVWGVGNDTELWLEANKGGHTRFLEHNPRWIERVGARVKAAVIHKVVYTTRIEDAASLLDSGGRLEMDLPAEIRERRWDVVLVDAPPGAGGGGVHGRMQSIFEASRLVAPDGRVFVHDVHRWIEENFAKAYLGDCRERIIRLGAYGVKARRPAP